MSPTASPGTGSGKSRDVYGSGRHRLDLDPDEIDCVYPDPRAGHSRDQG